MAVSDTVEYIAPVETAVAVPAPVSRRHVIGGSKPVSARGMGILMRIILGTVFFIVCFVVLWPIVHMVSAAFTPGRTIANLPVVPFSNGFTTANFVYVFTQHPYFRWFLNTLIIATASTLGTLLFASLGAYVFSRFNFTFKRGMLMSFLILNVFPSFVGMVAIFVILLRIGGLDTLWGMILIYWAGNIPFSTWMVKSYMDQVPRSLDEAARLDGATSLRIFWQIVLPMSKPILTFLAVTTFTTPWMDFILPNIILRSPNNQTLALGLFSFVTERVNHFTAFAAGSLIVAVPFMIFFVATQKMLISSLAGGAVKG